MANGAARKGEVGLDALWDNFVRLGRDGVTTLLVPWMVIAFVDLVFVGISIAIYAAAGGARMGAGASIFTQLVTLLEVVVVMTLRVALLKVMRDVAFRGPVAVRTLQTVGLEMGRQLVPALAVTVVTGAAVAVGFALCVLPGVVALFFLAFAPYLVVARGLPLGEGLVESARWASRQWVLLLSALIIAVLAGGFMACTVGLVGSFGTGSALSAPAGMVAGWVANTVLGYIAYLWWGAVYVTADSAEQVTALKESAPRPTEMPSTYPYHGPDQGSSSSSSDGEGVW